MNTIFYVLAIEGGVFGLAILLLVIYEISLRHPQAFQLPKVVLPKPTFGFLQGKDIAQPRNSLWNKLQADARLVWKPTEPEFFTSPDGNTLYLSAKLTNNWKPEQVVLYMLSQKDGFIEQIKASDPTAFEAINVLLTKLTTAKVVIAFKKMNIFPSFTKTMVVWKLPLLELPEAKVAEDIIVKELNQ